MRRQLGIRIRESLPGKPDSYVDIEDARIEDMDGCYAEKENDSWVMRGEVEKTHLSYLKAYAESIGKGYEVKSLPEGLQMEFQDGSSLVSQVVAYPLYENRTVEELEEIAWALEAKAEEYEREMASLPEGQQDRLEDLSYRFLTTCDATRRLRSQLLLMQWDMEERQEEEELPFE